MSLPRLRTRRLRTGLDLTELGMGVSQFGNLYRETTDDEAASAVAAAWAGGIRYVDTAPHYGLGLSERRLGALVAGWPRDGFVLSTKVGRLLVDDPDGAGRLDDEGFAVPATLRRVWDFSADGVRRSLEQSLRRLGQDRVDIVYLHDPDDHWEQASIEAIPALVALREQGVIGAVGVGMNQSAMLAEFVRRCDVDVVMCANRYTLLDQSALDDLLPAALERGVGVVAAAVYNSGVLARERPAAGARFDYGAAPEPVIARANAIADVCQAFGVTLPQAAVNFPLQHPGVVSVVLGSRSGVQVGQGLDSYRAEPPDDLWCALAEAHLVRLPGQPHQR
ncbi:MAG: aldo/keto reductase [Propionicimonas sp.]|nr:aldo/keto reductase [Propionicimonas sp.]